MDRLLDDRGQRGWTHGKGTRRWSLRRCCSAPVVRAPHVICLHPCLAGFPLLPWAPIPLHHLSPTVHTSSLCSVLPPGPSHHVVPYVPTLVPRLLPASPLARSLEDRLSSLLLITVVPRT